MVAKMIFRTQLDANGNPNVVYLWSNAGNRKLNLNWTDNRWNSNTLVAGVRDSSHFSAIGGVLLV